MLILRNFLKRLFNKNERLTKDYKKSSGGKHFPEKVSSEKNKKLNNLCLFTGLAETLEAQFPISKSKQCVITPYTDT